MDLDSLNKKVIPDPLTGGEQTVYWNNEGTYMLCVPHKGIELPKDAVLPKVKITDNLNGIKTWEIYYAKPENK